MRHFNTSQKFLLLDQTYHSREYCQNNFIATDSLILGWYKIKRLLLFLGVLKVSTMTQTAVNLFGFLKKKFNLTSILAKLALKLPDRANVKMSKLLQLSETWLDFVYPNTRVHFGM